MSNQIDEKLLPSIEQVVTYLELSGWAESTSTDKKIRVFSHPVENQGQDISLMLPAQTSFKDAPFLLAEFIGSLASLSDMSPSELIAQIGSPVTDILRLRLIPQGDKKREEYVSVDEVWVIVSGIREALAFSAQAEAAPADDKPESFAKLTGAGKGFVRTCRFAHTFKGSFGLTVESPLDLTQLLLPFITPEEANFPIPFKRRVMERFARGLRTVEAATENNDATIISSAFKTGFNANICDALFKIFEQTALLSMECKFLWTVSLQASTDSYVTSSTLSRKSASYLKIAADQLKKRPETKYATLFGLVRKMDEAQPSGTDGVSVNKRGFGQRVVIETQVDERIFRVAMFLNDEQHKLACNAYRDKKVVSVTGTLEQKNRSSILHLPDQFQILKSEDIPDYLLHLL